MYSMNNRTNEKVENIFFEDNKIQKSDSRNCYENSYLDKMNTTLKWSKNLNFNNIFTYQNSEDNMREKLTQLEKNKNNQILFQQSKMAAMGAMIENIVHQWKQPLSHIAAVASGIKFKNDAGELESKDIDNSTESINDSVQHLAQTLDDFRNFFKEDKYSKQFLLHETFEKVSRLLLSHFIPHNIFIVNNIEEITVEGYENELIQVLINILNNARDELIKIKENKKLILIDIHRNKEYLEIIIKDNAGGISDEIIDKVFDSHFTTKEDIEGTGIGLYMSKIIVTEHMKGSIEVRNSNFIYEEETYTGAEFKITIPKNLSQTI